MSFDDDPSSEDELYEPPEPPDDYEPPGREEDEREDPNPRAVQPALALAPPPPLAPVVPIAALVTTECSKCKHVIKPYYRSCPKCEGDRNLDKVNTLAQAIRELKEMSLRGDTDPERERRIMKELKIHDHPDIAGLVRWCQDAREKASTRSSGSRGKKQW